MMNYTATEVCYFMACDNTCYMVYGLLEKGCYLSTGLASCEIFTSKDDLKNTLLSRGVVMEEELVT